MLTTTKDNYLSRLFELIEYARQTALMRDNPKTSVEDYKIFTEHEQNLKDLPGVQSNGSAADGEDEIWLSVARLREISAPPPSTELLKIWLEISDDPNIVPHLKSSVTVQTLEGAGIKLTGEDGEPLSPAKQIALENFQMKERVESEFERYFENFWKSWSASEKPRRRTIGLYGRLFALKQQLEGGITDAQVELVLGIGIAVWKMNGTDVRLPLITKGVELSLNEKTMAIEIRPREQDPRVELEIYSNADNPGVPQVQKAAGEFFGAATETISPFEKSTFESLLRSAVALLDSRGVYLPDENSPDGASRDLPPAAENLKVTDSWVLFARPRGASLFIDDLERFQRTLKIGAENLTLPPAVAAIVTEPSNVSEDLQLPSFRGISMISGGSAEGNKQKAQDLFFPMPFNDEQVRIVQMLEDSDGVVVQGPPGTGKTHTIANIICHYLALGKRVLVTSMREPALTVLQEKLPEEIRPLAVSLLMNENAGMKQFQFAIERIASIVQLVNKDNQIREIARQETEIDNYHLFEREVYDILTERGYKVTPQVPVAGFRLDMVVEGDNDHRLAIECDGDRYHGPDKWEDDMRRQRILERAGWQFWRSFASTFVMHRAEVVADLINSLEQRGIKPVKSDGRHLSRFVEHIRYSLTEEKIDLPTNNSSDAPVGEFETFQKDLLSE